VALEAIEGELTIAQPTAKRGVHQTLINAWKKQAIEGLSAVFWGKAEAAEAARADDVERLHAKIGQLVVGRNFLSKACGR
jgi:transposase